MKEKVEEMSFHVTVGNPVYYRPSPRVQGQCWKSPDALHLLFTLAFLLIFH